VNVSQRLHEEEPSRKVVHTWVDCLAWDRRLSPNPHALAIYLSWFHNVLTSGEKVIEYWTKFS
jgi:hypothetical protein